MCACVCVCVREETGGGGVGGREGGREEGVNRRRRSGREGRTGVRERREEWTTSEKDNEKKTSRI